MLDENACDFPLQAGFKLRMQAFLALVSLLFSTSPFWTINGTQSQSPQLVDAQGILSQHSDSRWQIQLTVDQPLRYKGKTVDVVRFTVDTFTEATWCRPNDGKNMEISGQIESLSDGIATIALDSINLSNQRPIPMAEALRTFGEPGPNEHPPGQPLYRFPYYLVLLDPPVACERCYVPLLISSEPLETIVMRKRSVDVAWITTYERDSIWELNGVALVTSNAIDASSHTLRFRGKNYRYESATHSEALHLLEHPMGTIPISRISLPSKEKPGANISDLIGDLHTVFRIRERQGWPPLNLSAKTANASPEKTRTPESTASTSELIVFDDGKVEYRYAPGCVNQFNPAWMSKSNLTVESWNWRANCPGSQQTEKTFEYSLTQQELAHLTALLNREEVKQVKECFCNAAPIFDNYEIEIPHPDSTQQILVTAFMPQHIELRKPPAITYLVCEAKLIAGKSSHQPTPDWCTDLPPLK